MATFRPHVPPTTDESARPCWTGDPCKNPDDFECVVNGLRKAGVVE
jgi:hypothetical protein